MAFKAVVCCCCCTLFAAESVYIWCKAMTMYHRASKVVKPKLEALTVAEGRLREAQVRHSCGFEPTLSRLGTLLCDRWCHSCWTSAFTVQAMLAAQTDKLLVCKTTLDTLQDKFQSKLSEKHRLEDNARVARAKMEQATSLILGLSGERQRWLADADHFNEKLQKLTGDCAISAAFLSYCGQFQQVSRWALQLVAPSTCLTCKLFP